MKFNEWFLSKLIVNRYPLPGEILKGHYKYIINVSDEYISYCYDAAMEMGIKYFWFPMNECTSEIGLNSIYVALQILYKAEQEQAMVLLHCHAGANRSPSVRDAYYYMRTKKHREMVMFDEEDEERTSEFLNIGKPINGKNNRLLTNISAGHLPAIIKMEKFLDQCAIQFEKEETHRGGGLDACKLKANI